MLGQHLTADKSVSPEDIDEALAIQALTGSRLGRILLAKGRLTAYRLHQAVASHHGLPFANLLAVPCDPTLLSAEDRHHYIRLSAIPWQRQDDTILIATCDPSRNLDHWASQRFKRYQLVITSPIDILRTLERHFAKEDSEDACERLAAEKPDQSAKRRLAFPRRWDMALFALLSAMAVYYWQPFLLYSFIVLNLFYAATLGFKLLLTVAAAFRRKPPVLSMPEKDLPVYTLMIPLLREKPETIAKLVTAIQKLDYPQEKLDVKLIVEEEDRETSHHIRKLGCPYIFEIVTVPPSFPQTKPKALNYALRFARGEYVTIYDAEDEPEPDQLRKALSAFRMGGRNVAAVQAKLNYFNRYENLLTRMFALEYAMWFDYLLPGLESLDLPIPFGGTSNHFPIEVLRRLSAWDPYNVTEDADLGVRLVREGYRVRLIDSVTWEESPLSIRAWMRQRTRWIKGYMQTSIVHLARPLKLIREIGLVRFMGVVFFIATPSIIFLTLPFTIAIGLNLMLAGITLPPWLFALAAGNLAASILYHMVIGGVSALRYRWWSLAPFSLLFPFYWIFHTLASFRALLELFTNPHFWDKTEHGMSRVASSSAA